MDYYKKHKWLNTKLNYIYNLIFKNRKETKKEKHSMG